MQFKVDGTNIGAPRTRPRPTRSQWGSINVHNGTHTLAAVARDSFGNATTSAGVAVNVQNEDGTPVNSLPPKKTPRQPSGETPDGGGSGGGGRWRAARPRTSRPR